MVDLTQSDIDSLQNLVNAGNYTQFYFELYQSGSTIAGLVRRRMIWNSLADFRADGLGSSGSGYAA